MVWKESAETTDYVIGQDMKVDGNENLEVIGFVSKCCWRASSGQAHVRQVREFRVLRSVGHRDGRGRLAAHDQSVHDLL